MSHFVTIETRITDATALEEACAELGLALLRDAEARGYSGTSRRGELVIRLKGPYDIAASRPIGSDTYALSTDWWGGHVEREVGAGYGRLLQLYGVHKTIREAGRRHLRVTRQTEADGTIKLSIAA